MLNSQDVTSLISIYPFRIRTVSALFVVPMYPYHPRRLAKSNIEKQNFSHRVNDVCNGSPSRIRRVLRISFGMTILPRSSTRRTMPVAFISSSPLKRKSAGFSGRSICRKRGIMYARWEKRRIPPRCLLFTGRMLHLVDRWKQFVNVLDKVK